MSIWILPLIVTVGIIALVYTSRTAELRLDSKTTVLSQWNTAFPDHPALGVFLEPSGFAALIDLEHNGTGLLWVSGNGTIRRVLTAGSVEQKGDVLRVRLPDNTPPPIDIEISDKILRRIWLETLKTVLEERT